jgi:hypothetical protein
MAQPKTDVVVAVKTRFTPNVWYQGALPVELVMALVAVCQQKDEQVTQILIEVRI